MQVIENQRAGGLAAHEDALARLQVLKARGQRAVLDFDAEEFQFVLVRALATL